MLPGMERSQLGFPRSTPSEGVHLGSRHESKICRFDGGRCEAVARSVRKVLHEIVVRSIVSRNYRSNSAFQHSQTGYRFECNRLVTTATIVLVSHAARSH